MRTETKKSYVITNININSATPPIPTTTTTTTMNPYGWWNILDVNVWGITPNDGGGYWYQVGPVSGYDLPDTREIFNASDMIDGYSDVIIVASWLNSHTKTSAFCGKLNSDTTFNIANAWRPTKLRITYEPADVDVMIWLKDFNDVDLVEPQNSGAQIISNGEEVNINWHDSEYASGLLGNQYENVPDNYNRSVLGCELMPVNGWRSINFRLLTFEMYGDDPYNYIQV